MFKFPLDADDTFLILAPRWADYGTAWQAGLLALSLFVPLALILWLYRHELRLISRWAASGLLLLRLSILLVIWFAVGVQPQVAQVYVTETPGRVRIAVDLSSSMDVADRQRTAEERASLQRALKLSDVDDLTRKQIVAQILKPDGMNLLKRLADRHQVEIVGFHQQAYDMESGQLLKALTATDAAKDIHATDLTGPLKKDSAGAEQPLLGIILFSDGKYTIGTPPYARAKELRQELIPIFPVVLGSRLLPNDLMILDTDAPKKTFKDDTIVVTVRCKVTNLPAQAMTVEMQVGKNKALPEHRSVIQHLGGNAEHKVLLKAKMDQAGTQVLSIRATSQGREITLANNLAERVIRVVDDKAKVLLVDAEARWEYHYLANALVRDAKITLERVVFDQPRIGALKDDQLEQAGLAKTKLPAPKAERPDYDPLMDFDCIVLGDVSPEQLPRADRKRLERFVAERGGTLILVAGKRYLPLKYTDADPQGNDPLVKMLPISAPRELRTDKGFTLRVSAEGKLQPFLHLESERPGNVWPELPKHFWGIVGKRKPAASVLLTPVLDKPDAPAKDDADAGILVQQNYGTGRVLFVGLDSTWRWRYRVGDVYHHRFWGQLVRWSATDKLLPAGNRWIRYGPREAVYEPGQEAELAVRLSELLPPLQDLSQARAKLYRKNADGSESLLPTIPLSKHPHKPNLLEANVPSLEHGIYRMELDIPQYREQLAEPSDEKDAPAKGGALFRVLPREQRELLDLSTNWIVMQSLAERTDGKLYTPENIEEIVERLARRIERTEDRRDHKPWQHAPTVWWMLGILLGLLTLEWGWRKWLDLP